MEQSQVPPNFRTLIADFCKDLSVTFPDYSYFWSKWTEPDVSEEEINGLFQHCLKVYPERFFDILYQNDDMFSSESLVNTDFLPRVSFRFLFHCEDVTEKTKKAMWKYLQLILFSIVGGVKDKANFGETMNLFEGIDEKELQEKLKETMGGITDFFSNMENFQGREDDSPSQDQNSSEGSPADHFKKMFESMGQGFGEAGTEGQGTGQGQGFGEAGTEGQGTGQGTEGQGQSGLPNMENIQDHLKELFDGKIGKLAKELADEISGEFGDLVGEDMQDAKSTQDVLKKLMKNPSKIMDLMKKVSGKLDSKMASGEISRDELMKEAGDLLGKMKDMGGQDQFSEMFKKMASSMGGLGKNMKLDTNAIDRMTKQASTRENLLSKLEQKKKMKEHELEKKKQEIRQRMEAQQKIEATYSLAQKDSPNNLVFRLAGEESQEKSFVHPDLLKEMNNEKANEKANINAGKGTGQGTVQGQGTGQETVQGQGQGQGTGQGKKKKGKKGK
jgi:hypothetical protein